MQIVTKVIADLAITTAKLGNLSVSTGKIVANAVTDAKILLANNAYLRGRNFTDSADINIARVNISNEIDGAGTWNFNDSLPKSTVTPTTATQLTTKTYVDTTVAAAITGNYESFTLIAADITNQYVDLAHIIKPNTLHIFVSGVRMLQGVDYTLSTVSLVTRVTFAGDLATGGAVALIAGDLLIAQYLY